MKIPDIKGLFSIARGVLDARKGQPAARQGEAAGAADKVELSTESQAVQRLAAERTTEKPRAADVAALKAQHGRGELAADVRGTAEAMVADGMFDDLIEGK